MSHLSEKCEDIYILAGKDGVHEFIKAQYPKTPWSWCPACACVSPRDTDYSCLVCATPTEPYWGQNEIE